MPGQGEAMYLLDTFLWEVSLFACFGCQEVGNGGLLGGRKFQAGAYSRPQGV